MGQIGTTLESLPLNDVSSTVPRGPVPRLRRVIASLSLTVGLTPESSIHYGQWADPEGAWIGRVRRLCVGTLRSHRQHALEDDAELLASELLTNALQHGAGDLIRFGFFLASGVALIVVTDGSREVPTIAEPDEDSERGRGLRLVHCLSARWGVTADGRTTWCLLRSTADTPKGDGPVGRSSGVED
ncbi:ATP-binding protein [Streptomyces sp. H-KF8]|uniref:ATP-binding protein n=1 Tax=Streptomyces sp. H-KF8 TaxID=1727216 RepID=UPI00133189DD|nr:ATP-binding protein [Streptomyces sp. H-KF8]